MQYENAIIKMVKEQQHSNYFNITISKQHIFILKCHLTFSDLKPLNKYIAQLSATVGYSLASNVSVKNTYELLITSKKNKQLPARALSPLNTFTLEEGKESFILNSVKIRGLTRNRLSD
ncbi:UNVERIFIED_CONTAM: hypothetical protein K2H54_035606 [Gekko kuhli]